MFSVFLPTKHYIHTCVLPIIIIIIIIRSILKSAIWINEISIEIYIIIHSRYVSLCGSRIKKAVKLSLT